MAIRTVDVDVLADQTGSLYEAVAILSKRARQISSKTKADLDEKLSYFEGFGTEVEDIQMNEEQTRISIEYERQPKPTERAINEMFDGEVYYRNPNETE